MIAYCTFGAAFGWVPLFAIPDIAFDDPKHLIPYLILALFMVLLAMIYTRTFYATVAIFHRWNVLPHVKPAVGALLTGIVAVGLYAAFGNDERALAVLSFGYGAVQGAVRTGSLWRLATVGDRAGKNPHHESDHRQRRVGWRVRAVDGHRRLRGRRLGVALHDWLPGMVPNPAAFVIVGMAGFFAAAAKTPFSTLIIVSEMTGGYHLLLPALWVCTIAFMLSDEQSIYSAQVEGRSRSPAHQGNFMREALAGVQVGRFLVTGSVVHTLRPGDTLPTILDRFDAATGEVLPVVDNHESLVGVVDLEEVYLASHTPELRPLLLAVDLMRAQVTPLTPEDSLETALELFVENELPALPIVNNVAERRLLGLVRRSDVAGAYLRLLYGPGDSTDGKPNSPHPG